MADADKLVNLADLKAAYDELKKTATGSSDGLLSATDKKKLNEIEAGAQVNSITGIKGNAESSYRTGNVNLTPANVGAVALSGDTMSGNLVVESSGAKIEAKNSTTGVQTQLLSSDGGAHGLRSEGYYDGSAYVSNPKWLIYRDTDGDVRVDNNPTYVILTSSDNNVESLYKKLSKLALNSAACVRVFDSAMKALSGKTISGGFGTVIKTGIEANNTLVFNFNICKPDGGYMHCFTTRISQTAINPGTIYRYTGTVVT